MSVRPDARDGLPPPEPLAALQRLLGGAFAGSSPIDAKHRWAEEIASVVADGPRLGALEQAEIYREQFWLRHRDVLYEDYPGLVHLLGTERFERFCRDYLDDRPPHSFTLRDLGDDLADYAASYPSFEPMVAGPARDMARFERAFVEIFDGAEVPPVAVEALRGIGPERLAEAVLTFHPLLVLLELDHPVHELRTALRRAERDEGDLPAKHLEPRPICLAMWRGTDLRVAYREIQPGELMLARLLSAGASLQTACARLLADVEPGEASRQGASLSDWMRGFAERGWITAVRLPSPPTDDRATERGDYCG